MEIKAIDISGGYSTIQYTDGRTEHYSVDGYAAMLACRQEDADWNVPAASGRPKDVAALAATIKRLASADA